MPEQTPTLEVIPLGQQIGRHLRRLRQARGLTQVELAKEAGTHKATVSLIESGRANPTAEFTQRIFHALGYDVTLRLLPCPYHPHGRLNAAARAAWPATA